MALKAIQNAQAHAYVQFVWEIKKLTAQQKSNLFNWIEKPVACVDNNAQMIYVRGS